MHTTPRPFTPEYEAQLLKLTLEPQDMTRLSFDAILLQSKLAAGETMTIDAAALNVFGAEQPDGTRTVTAVSKLRAQRAATNLVTLKRADATPNPKNMTAITARDLSPGTQLEALMNLAVRAGYKARIRQAEEDAESLDSQS